MARIALDAMGGDHAPVETVAGAVASGVDVVLVGDEAQLAPLVGDSGLPIVHAEDVIDMADDPAKALREKRQSSSQSLPSWWQTVKWTEWFQPVPPGPPWRLRR